MFIGDISDYAKKNIALKLREQTENSRNAYRIVDKQIDHLYYSINFFKTIAEEKKLIIEILHEDVPELNFYNNARYRYSVILRDDIL